MSGSASDIGIMHSASFQPDPLSAKQPLHTALAPVERQDKTPLNSNQDEKDQKKLKSEGHRSARGDFEAV